MKHQILLSSICVLLFFSCKKEQKAPSNDQKYPVSFKVAGFSLNQASMNGVGKLKAAALTADSIPVQHLVYALFKVNDLVPTTIRRFTKGDPGFGTISDNVPPGNYIATFTGGSDTLVVTDVQVGPDYIPYFFSYSEGGAAGGANARLFWDDTFYKRVPITVTSSGISQQVSVDRVTSRLDLVIKDPIPAGTSKIVVAFRDTGAVDVKSGKTIPFSTMNNYTEKVINTTDIGKVNYTMTIFNLNNIKPFDVTVSYYGANPNGPVDTKIIKNVVCKTNTKTILSGNLFTPGNTAFAIAINQAWDAPVTINF